MNTDVLDRLFTEWVSTKPEFSPLAYYIKDLDTVIVLSEDCSTTVQHVAGTLISLHHLNHEEMGKRNYVGFEVECAKEFCQCNGVPFGEKIDLVSVLQKMADTNKAAAPAILDVAIPLVEDNNIDSVIF